MELIDFMKEKADFSVPRVPHPLPFTLHIATPQATTVALASATSSDFTAARLRSGCCLA
jgi:hypothetical protein